MRTRRSPPLGGTLLLLVALCACSSPRTVGPGDAGGEAGRTADLAAHDAAAIPDVGPPDRAVTVDAAVADRAVTGDLNLSFPQILDGVWLVGWSGGMNHFSWVRFAVPAPAAALEGEAWILDGQEILGNEPFWHCSGKARWWMGAAAFTVYLDFPSADCLQTASGPVATMGYVFGDYAPATSTDPQGAILVATVKDQPTLTARQGYKFPRDWCDAPLTSCKPPF